jgi:hypothetical protein
MDEAQHIRAQAPIRRVYRPAGYPQPPGIPGGYCPRPHPDFTFRLTIPQQAFTDEARRCIFRYKYCQRHCPDHQRDQEYATFPVSIFTIVGESIPLHQAYPLSEWELPILNRKCSVATQAAFNRTIVGLSPIEIQLERQAWESLVFELIEDQDRWNARDNPASPERQQHDFSPSPDRSDAASPSPLSEVE